MTTEVTHSMVAKKATQPVEEGLVRRSYFTTQETHSMMEQGAEANECTMYQFLAAAIEAFNPKKHPEHRAILDRMAEERQVREMTRTMSNLDPEVRKLIIKNLMGQKK